MSTAIVNVSRSPFARLSTLIAEARRRDSLLFWTAAAHIFLIPLLLAGIIFDERLVTGINPWIKPLKFAVAGAVYLLTLAWFMGDLPASEKARRRVSRLVALSMSAEIVLITLQAARGASSHFNNSTPFDAAVFGLMGLMIVVNTIAVGYVTWRFWRADAPLLAAYLWGVRLGLLFFILAGLEGFVMTSRLSHSVGAADGGPGLPLINWSTRAGDLRVAHFVGMHSLQVLPLVGSLLSAKDAGARDGNAVRWLWLAAVAYGGLALLLFVQALAGRPLISW